MKYLTNSFSYYYLKLNYKFVLSRGEISRDLFIEILHYDYVKGFIYLNLRVNFFVMEIESMEYVLQTRISLIRVFHFPDLSHVFNFDEIFFSFLFHRDAFSYYFYCSIFKLERIRWINLPTYILFFQFAVSLYINAAMNMFPLLVLVLIKDQIPM